MASTKTTSKTARKTTIQDSEGTTFILSATRISEVYENKPWRHVKRSAFKAALKGGGGSVDLIFNRHPEAGYPVLITKSDNGAFAIGCKDFSDKDAKKLNRWLNARSTKNTKKSAKKAPKKLKSVKAAA